MSEWKSYQKSQKEWQFTKLRNSLKLNKPYVHFLADNGDLGEIENIIKEYGYKIFYRDKLFFITGLFCEKVEK
jgi:hypothetical protein